MQNEAAQYLDFIDEDEQRRRQAKRVLFGLLIGLVLIAGWCIENGYNTVVVLICTAILFTMLLLVNTANHRKALRSIFSAGPYGGHLGLSGAENPESNEQGAGRQRAPRADEFVSKNTLLRRRIDNY